MRTISTGPLRAVKPSRVPPAVKPGCPQRYDVGYERKGTANNFMFIEPLGNWRRVSVRERKTGVDWAIEIKELLDVDYPTVEKIILVCDNLNTHRPASLYEAFPPDEARRLSQRLEIHYTPKHGSWLNIAESELSILTRQCLDRRIPTIQLLRSETAAWAEKRNQKQIGVDWQFETSKARIKLKRLYPQF